MNFVLFLVGEFLFLFLIFSLILIDTPLVVFVDIIGIVLCLGIGSALTIISFSIKDITSAFFHAFGAEATKQELKKSAYVWECVARNLIMASGIGVMIGLIKYLQNFSDPATIGPSFAVLLLCVFYGIFFSAIFPFPAMFMIKKRIEAE